MRVTFEFNDGRTQSEFVQEDPISRQFVAAILYPPPNLPNGKKGRPFITVNYLETHNFEFSTEAKHPSSVLPLLESSGKN